MIARRLFASLALALTAAAGCSGTTVPYTFEGEPVCPDFSIGAAEPMRGGLKRPLHVVFKDGKEIVARVLLPGLRAKGEPATPILLPDTNAEYDVEWGECENERAPGVVSKNKPFDTKFECGEAKVYATTKLATKKGDASRKVVVTPPPDPSCWSAPSP